MYNETTLLKLPHYCTCAIRAYKLCQSRDRFKRTSPIMRWHSQISTDHANAKISAYGNSCFHPTKT